ncbi:unnamed protein product [Cuscuta campestris]|uniref:MADS-box domain-containing protein n=1 Tax=Cuscuta campestris TaxID=132261 RepID=A0A484NMH5_9ASTE|nr:unnamed protein product [Cuscuta campestris]
MSDNNNSNKRVRRGRQRIPLTKIENDVHRQVTFSKRRSGVFKKASELSTLCGVDIAMVIFSPTNKAYTFGNPSLNAVLNRYFGENPNARANVTGDIIRARHEAIVGSMTPQISEMESMIRDLTNENHALCEAEKNRPSVPDLQEPELERMKNSLEMLRNQVVEKLNQLHFNQYPAGHSGFQGP